MKYIAKILYVIIGLFLILYINKYVQAGDVCRTIYGCFTLWLWFWHKNN